MRRALVLLSVLVVVGLATQLVALGAPSVWSTYQHDAGRTGLDPDQAPVTSVGPAWSATLDGGLYAQPLVVGNIVYVATQNNTVYAFAADTGNPVWAQPRHVATPAQLNQLPCGNVDPYGIVGTPVIDTTNNTLYVVALVSSPAIHHELYALNSADGLVRYHYGIDAPGSDPSVHGQRGALTLANSRIYVVYSGRAGDCGSYIGRVVAVTSGDPTGASLISYSLPNTTRGGIWAAASADGNGNVYIATGNSGATGSTPDRGESVVKLSPTLQELDFFTAPEWRNMNQADDDLGSIGPMVLQNGWILQSAKNGMGYLINSARMGQVGGQLFEAPLCPGEQAIGFGAYLAPNTVFIPCTTSLKKVQINTGGTPSFTVSTVRAGYSGGQASSPPIISGGVLWNLDRGAANGQPFLLGFDPSTGAQLFTQSLAHTPQPFAAPGSGAGHIFVPDGSTLAAFTLNPVPGGSSSTATATPTPTSTSTPMSPPTQTSTPTPTVVPTATHTPTAVPPPSGGGGGGNPRGGGGGGGHPATGAGGPPAGGASLAVAAGPPLARPALDIKPPAPPAASPPLNVAGVTTEAAPLPALRESLTLAEAGLSVTVPQGDDAATTVGLLGLAALPSDSLPDPPVGFQPGSHAFRIEVAETGTGQQLTNLVAPLALSYQPEQAEITKAEGDLSRIQLALHTSSGWLGLGCTSGGASGVLSCEVPYAGEFESLILPPAGTQDWDLPNGHVFKQANGFGGAGDLGYEVVDDSAAALWTEFQRLGGVDVVGYPISNRFSYRGFLTQAFQKLVLQWQPDLGQVTAVNVLDDLDQHSSDAWLNARRQIPRPSPSNDVGLDFSSVMDRHTALLNAYPALSEYFSQQPDAVARFGLPTGVYDYGSLVSVRLQRAVLQLWQIDTPWAASGAVVVGNGGDLAKQAGLWPLDALSPVPALEP